MKKIDIFYKTYNRDFWLMQLSLKTITKNVTGYNNIIILVPENEKELFDTRGMPERTLIHYIGEYGSTYLYQQVCKLQAYKYCDAEYILFCDSDCMWDHPIDLQEFVKDDKPEILFTDYNKVDQAICWKAPTEKMIGESVEWEYMRRNCLIYHRSTLENINKWKPDLEKIVMGSQSFSEFNLIGAWANKFEKERYTWINTDDWTYVEPKATQVWSHASKEPGVSETHLREYIRTLETVIKSFCIKIQ